MELSLTWLAIRRGWCSGAGRGGRSDLVHVVAHKRRSARQSVAPVARWSLQEQVDRSLFVHAMSEVFKLGDLVWCVLRVRILRSCILVPRVLILFVSLSGFQGENEGILAVARPGKCWLLPFPLPLVRGYHNAGSLAALLPLTSSARARIWRVLPRSLVSSYSATTSSIPDLAVDATQRY